MLKLITTPLCPNNDSKSKFKNKYNIEDHKRIDTSILNPLLYLNILFIYFNFECMGGTS